MPTFTPRTYKVPLAFSPADEARNFWAKLSIDFSFCLLKNGTSYTEVISPTAEQVDAATITYYGGHTYVVSAGEAAALTAAGYGSQVTASGFPYTFPISF